jgi:hypothetical protein
MNDSSLENLLRSLKPTAPSADLADRVQQEMLLGEVFASAHPLQRPAMRATVTWLSRFTWSALGAAATVALMQALPGESGSMTTAAAPVLTAPILPAQAQISPADSLPAINSTREILGVDEAGIVYAADGTPEQLLSVAAVERHQWVDPRDGAIYTLELPQADQVLLPVSFY